MAAFPMLTLPEIQESIPIVFGQETICTDPGMQGKRGCKHLARPVNRSWPTIYVALSPNEIVRENSCIRHC